MIKLTLFSTLGCHLCEQAERLLAQIADSEAIEWQVIDIASDPGLVDRYGIRIPVVRDRTSDQELGWPFDDQGFRNWLKTCLPS